MAYTYIYLLARDGGRSVKFFFLPERRLGYFIAIAVIRWLFGVE
jgi:hypothetical protein